MTASVHVTAGEAIVAALSPQLYRYALVRLGRVDLAEDAVGETLCRLVEKGPAMVDGDQAHITGWSVRCLVNVCREVARRPRTFSAERALDEAGGTYRLDEWRSSRTTEETGMLIVALGKLSERQHEAVTLRVLMGLSVSAAAVAMECAEGTVKALTHQGIATLRAQLAEDDSGTYRRMIS